MMKKLLLKKVFVIFSKDEMIKYSKDELHFIERELISLFKSSSYEIMNKNQGQGKELDAFTKESLKEEMATIISGLEALGINVSDPLASTINKRDNVQNAWWSWRC